MRGVCFLLVILLAACTPTLQTPALSPQELEQEQRTQYRLLFDTMLSSKNYQKQERLLNVVFPLLQAAAPFCPDNQIAYGGLLFFEPSAFDDPLLGIPPKLVLEDGLKVLFVTPGFAAEKEGIRARDTVIMLGGVPLAGSDTTQAVQRYETLIATGQPVAMKVRSPEGNVRSVTIRPVPICHYPPILVGSRELNAYTDGTSLYITARLFKFVSKDEELALVMGHEIAHNLLGHLRKKYGNALLGSLVDVALLGATGTHTDGLFSQVGGLVYSEAFEREADYMGLYLLARAGFPVEHVADFWRRMAMEAPESIGYKFLATHPSTPERFLAIRKATEEIRAKQSKGVPLLPEKR